LEEAVDVVNSTLFHCVKALVTGENREKIELKGNSKFQIFMAAENIWYAVKLGGSPLHSLMSCAPNVFSNL